MYLKSLTALVFAVGHVFSLNITAVTGGIDERKSDETKICYANNAFVKAFICTNAGQIIAEHLSEGDLRNMAKVPIMSGSANFVLDRRSRMLHYRNGKITLPHLAEALKRISEKNFTKFYDMHLFAKGHWSPFQAILFGGEKALNLTGAMQGGHVLIASSQNDHLKIFISENPRSMPVETKRDGMNGVIIPQSYPSRIFAKAMQIRAIDLWDPSPRLRKSYMEDAEQRMKLAIVISSDDKVTGERAESRALRTAQKIRNIMGSAPICVVAQSDIRPNVMENTANYVDSSVSWFRGSKVHASTLVVNAEDEETLEREFEKWKRELPFLDSHHTTAFHFTVLNGTEPENSEEIFSKTFPDIPLSTLRLLGGPSITGVNYQVGTESRFCSGPVYAIVGLPKFSPC